MVDGRILTAQFPGPFNVRAATPVIFMTFEFGDTGRADDGECVHFGAGIDLRGYALINVYNHAPDNGTLVHELGHCAGLNDVFLRGEDAHLTQEQLAAKYALLPMMLVQPVEGRPRTGLTRDEVLALARTPLGPPSLHQNAP